MAYKHVCPWWIGYFLASPLRRLLVDPARILGPYVHAGATALDVGPGMGFYTLPLARLVGEGGRVVAVDLQERMLASLARRARRAGLAGRIETRLCRTDSLSIDDLEGKVDFALVMYMAHEVPDKHGLFAQLSRALAPGGVILLAEPRGHVSEKAYAGTLDIARASGLEPSDGPRLSRGLTSLLRGQAPSL